MRPESEIPTVPLAKLISNTNLMADHFDHYSRAQMSTGTIPGSATTFVKTSGNLMLNRSSSPSGLAVARSPAASPGLKTPAVGEVNSQRLGADPSGTTAVSEQQTSESGTTQGLTRRRTMPVFMTQKPANIKFRRNIPTVAERTRKVFPFGSL